MSISFRWWLKIKALYEQASKSILDSSGNHIQAYNARNMCLLVLEIRDGRLSKSSSSILDKGALVLDMLAFFMVYGLRHIRAIL